MNNKKQKKVDEVFHQLRSLHVIIKIFNYPSNSIHKFFVFQLSLWNNHYIRQSVREMNHLQFKNCICKCQEWKVEGMSII